MNKPISPGKEHCVQCVALTINGVYCHESGCPIGYKDLTVECRWCGTPFKPKYVFEKYCSMSCYGDDKDLEN